MKESSWNKVIWQAMENIKNSSIDEIFSECERRLHFLKASEKEINLRLLALALYCNKMYNSDFFRSVIFSRFAEVVEIFRFEMAAKKLIKENNPVLVVFWVVFRLSSENFISKNSYLPLEKHMRCKSLEIASKFTILPSQNRE